MTKAAPLILTAIILALATCARTPPDTTPVPTMQLDSETAPIPSGNGAEEPAPTKTYIPIPNHTPAPTYTPAPTFTPEPTYTPPPTYTPEPTYTPNAPTVPATATEKVAEAAGRFYDCMKANPEMFQTMKSEIAAGMDQGMTGIIDVILENREMFVWSFSEMEPESPELRMIDALLDSGLCRP